MAYTPLTKADTLHIRAQRESNRLRPYPTYKPSGIDWLGDVPEHWEVRRLKSVGNIRYGLGQPPREASDGLPLIRATNVERGRITDKDMLYVDPEDVPKGRDAILKAGEIIVVRSGAYTADSAIVPGCYGGAVSGYDMVVTAMESIRPEFLAFTLLSTYLRDNQLIVASTRSAQPHLNAEELGTSILLLPPIGEQAAIVRHLDHAGERIQRAISVKEHLIELLTEQRQAIIHRAVTRGLDPNVRLKDSGVEWIGEVPEHWETTIVKRHYDVQLGKMLQPRPNSPDDIEVPYLKAQHVHWNHIRTDDPPTMWATSNEVEQFGIRRGDLLIVEGGAGATNSAILQHTPDNYIIQNALHRVRPRRARNDFLLFIMMAVASSGWFEGINNKATIPHFTKEKLDRLPIPHPSTSEQAAIVRHLNKATADIDVSIEIAQRQIEMLGEYRTRLIADVVTGKVDVRKV